MSSTSPPPKRRFEHTRSRRQPNSRFYALVSTNTNTLVKITMLTESSSLEGSSAGKVYLFVAKNVQPLSWDDSLVRSDRPTRPATAV